MTGIQVMPDQQFQMMQQQQSLPMGAVSQSEFDGAIAVLKSDKLRGFKVDYRDRFHHPVDRMQDQQKSHRLHWRGRPVPIRCDPGCAGRRIR